MRQARIGTIFCMAGLLAGQATAENARHVELCELVAHAAEFADQIVETDSSITFSYHASTLVDPKCKASVTVWFPTDNLTRPDLDRLKQLGFVNMGGEPRVFGTFRGRFRDNSKQDPKRFLEDGIPFLLIELEAVSNLRTSAR